MRDTSGIPQNDDAEPTIADLRDLPLEVVLGSDDSALGHALRRLLQGIARPGENYAAHGSTTSAQDGEDVGYVGGGSMSHSARR